MTTRNGNELKWNGNNFIEPKLTWTAILFGAAVEKVGAEVYCWAAAAVETVDAGGNCCGRVLSR